MKLRKFLLLLPVAILMAAASHAQQLSINQDPTIYRLDQDALFQDGCFPPCLCPFLLTAEIRGTFELGPRQIGNVVDFREVTEVNWTVGTVGQDIHRIAGHGSYRITNFGPPQEHALDLYLSIDGGDPQHFFSDFQPVDANDGSIDLTVSINGQFCHDIVIRVSAAPVPPADIYRYGLAAGSTYQQGCFDPCYCPLEEPRPLRGRFTLVRVFDTGTYAEFSVQGVRFASRPRSVTDPPINLFGAGRYTLIQGFAGPAHAMELRLDDGSSVVQFDAELENTHVLFPRIDIVVDMNDMVCFDRVLTLKSKPVRVIGPSPIADPGQPVTPRGKQ